MESQPLEEWRPVAGQPGYEISNQGRLRSIKSGKPRILKPYTDKLGYVRISAGGSRLSIHRAVAEAWFGPCPEGKEVDHINGIRNDNRVENLRYLTHQENMACRHIEPSTHCQSGRHELSGHNLYIRPNGARSCRACMKDTTAKWRKCKTDPCTVSGCDRGATHHLRTDSPICEMHYQRVRRHGDPTVNLNVSRSSRV